MDAVLTLFAQSSGCAPQQPDHSLVLQLQHDNEQLRQAVASLQQELQRCKLLVLVALIVHLMPHQCYRVGQSGGAVARQALSPRRSAFKSLLKKGAASGKENSCGQTETLQSTKQKQQAQALSDVAAAAGVAAGAECSDLRALCLQVRADVA